MIYFIWSGLGIMKQMNRLMIVLNVEFALKLRIYI